MGVRTTGNSSNASDGPLDVYTRPIEAPSRQCPLSHMDLPPHPAIEVPSVRLEGCREGTRNHVSAVLYQGPLKGVSNYSSLEVIRDVHSPPLAPGALVHDLRVIMTCSAGWGIHQPTPSALGQRTHGATGSRRLELLPWLWQLIWLCSSGGH